MEILRLNNVSKSFGGLRAVDHVSFFLEEGEIYGLIGPNGAGKTTLLNIISGIYRPDEGEIKFNGQMISGKPPYSQDYRYITRTFQIPKLWKKLDVLSNILVAGYTKSEVQNVDELKQRAREILKFLGIDHLERVPVSQLSGGQAKLLEFGRAVVCDVKLLLLDEPFAGVSPAIMQKQMDYIIRLSEQKGVSVLIISHMINKLVEMVDKIGVMHSGKLIAEGFPYEVLNDRMVVEAYIGGESVVES